MLIVNKLSIGLLLLVSGSVVAQPAGNTTIASFSTAKKIMQKHICTTKEQRKTKMQVYEMKGLTKRKKTAMFLAKGFKAPYFSNCNRQPVKRDNI
ncbi:hypothetical protein [Vibrio atypicus]|uniref:hypothetical protein n=1 Tax=Vibrio atypicus TaxID=558271 RepID=UPI00373589AA